MLLDRSFPPSHAGAVALFTHEYLCPTEYEKAKNNLTPKTQNSRFFLEKRGPAYFNRKT
jgi:hypothetical protein